MHGPSPPPLVAPPVVAPPVVESIGCGSDDNRSGANLPSSPQLFGRVFLGMISVSLVIVLIIVPATRRDPAQTRVANVQTWAATHRLDHLSGPEGNSRALPLLASSQTDNEPSNNKPPDNKPLSASTIAWQPVDPPVLSSRVDLDLETQLLDLQASVVSQAGEQSGDDGEESITPQSPSPPENATAADQQTATATLVTTTSQHDLPPVEQVVEAPLPPAPDARKSKPLIQSLQSLDSLSETSHPVCVDGSCQEGMESLGTAVKWADSPGDAYRLAGQQDKLVFLIHVSGNFEIPGFT